MGKTTFEQAWTDLEAGRNTRLNPQTAEHIHELAEERNELQAENERLLSIITALRSQMLIAASRIRAYSSPAYDDRHDYQNAGTLEWARKDLMAAYNESAELIVKARAAAQEPPL